MSIPPHPRPPRSGRRLAGERRVRERRVLWVGVALSLVVHVIAVAIASRLLDPEVRIVPVPRAERPVEPQRGLRAVEVAIRSDGEPVADAPVLPDDPRPVERVDPDAAEEPDEAAPQVAAAERRTAAERLAPRVVDPRLWRPIVVLPRDPTLQDVQDRVAAAVEMLSDSALAAAERAMRAVDWTIEDESGGRWGISPGQIHLGKLTLPLPLSFPSEPDHLSRASYWIELESQLERALLLESFEERVRAIRERRDREREGRRRATENGNPGG